MAVIGFISTVIFSIIISLSFPTSSALDANSTMLNSSLSPWVGGLDMVNDLILEETLSRTSAELDGEITALAIDECERLQKLNSTFLLTSVNNMTNANSVKCLGHAPVLTYSSAVRAAILTAMAILSFIGNIATIISIRKSRTEKRMGNHTWNAVYALILHLSVADLLVTLFCITGEAAWSYTVAWHAGNISCKIFKFLQMFSLYLSTFVLVLIGVDRFVVVRYPMKSLTASKRLNKLIIFAWVLSLVLSIPQLFIFHVEKGPFYEEFYQCVTYGFYTERWQEQLYTTFSLVCMFILPLLILISTYVSTFITIARSEKMFRTEGASNGKYAPADVNRRRLIHRAKMKSMRISVVIVAAFIVWWTPYYTMMIIFMFLNPDKHLSEDLQSGIFFFGMSNSLVNPIIYGAFHLWQPHKKRTGSYNSDYRSSYRECGLQRRSTMNSNYMMDPRGSTRVLRPLDRMNTKEEIAGLMTLNELVPETTHLSSRCTQRFNGLPLSRPNTLANI